jgi:phytoene dehydrogenase-like protein
MTMLAQDVGLPVSVGGAGQLTAALVARAQAAGAEVECAQPVQCIEVSAGRAGCGGRGERRVRARRAIVAHVCAPDLYQRRLAPGCGARAGFIQHR